MQLINRLNAPFAFHRRGRKEDFIDKREMRDGPDLLGRQWGNSKKKGVDDEAENAQLRGANLHGKTSLDGF